MTISKNNFNYIPELDGLRFCSFLLVFFNHNSSILKYPFFSCLHSYGWIGVDIFFILSAYLITQILTKEYIKNEYINLKNFYFRRFLRIAPLYLSFSILSLILYYLKEDINIQIFIKNILLRFLGLITFTDNIISIKYGFNSIPFTSHLWSISYEQQVYFILPFIVCFLLKQNTCNKILFMISIYITLSLLKIFFIINDVKHPAIWVLPFTHFESILYGIYFAIYEVKIQSINIKYKSTIYLHLIVIIAIIIYFISIIPAINIISFSLILNYNLSSLLVLIILNLTLFNNYLKKLLSNSILVYLGKHSFGLYIFHLFGNEISRNILNKLHISFLYDISNIIFSLLISIILSIISYNFVEKKFVLIKRKFNS